MVIAVLMSVLLAIAPIYAEIYPDAEYDVITIAGTGTHGSRDGEFAQFNLPSSIFSDGAGNLFVLDTYNNLIRLIEFDENGNAYVSRFADADFNRPTGGFWHDGWIVFTDSQNHTILQIYDGYVYSIFSGEPGHADGNQDEAKFYHPTAIVMGPCGNVFVADTFNHVIRMIDPDGYVSTIAGTPGVYGFADGAADQAIFNMPMGLAICEDGVIFVADTENHLIRVIEDGFVRTLAGTLIFPSEIEWDENYEWDFDEEPMGGFADGFEAMFNFPTGLFLFEGALIVADTANHSIRAVFIDDGEVITIAGTGYPGHVDGPMYYVEFHFPRGVYVFGDWLLVVDTGNNIIRGLI